MPDGTDDDLKALTRRTALVALVVAIAVAAAFGLERALSPGFSHGFGHSASGHLLGWVGLLMILIVFAYPAQKRFRPNHIWSKPWLYVHEIFGTLGFVVILIHSGAHFHALVPVLTLVALALVVLSGVVGEILHTLAFRSLYQRRHELAREGLSEDAIEARLHELAGREGLLRLWPWVHVPLTAAFVVLALVHVVGALYFGGM